MARDIELITEEVKLKIPTVEIVQLRKIHPADDDGLWYFCLKGVLKDIQIEAPDGNCPFLVETDELCCANARTANSVAEAVSMIVDYLHLLQQS